MSLPRHVSCQLYCHSLVTSLVSSTVTPSSLLSLCSLSLPLSLQPQHGVSQEDIIRGNITQEVRDATYDCASLAHTHLTKSRHLRSKLPKPALRAFLPAVSPCHLWAVSGVSKHVTSCDLQVPCEAFLQRIQHCSFDPLDPRVLQRRPWLPLSLLRAAWTNTF